MNKKEIVFVYYVFGDYMKYIPYCIYGVLKSYPDSYVKVYIQDNLTDDIKAMLNMISSKNFIIKENYYNNIIFSDNLNIIGGASKVLKWLIPYNELSDFKYAYIGDIDMLIVNEIPSLLNNHINHMNDIKLPFSNSVRDNQKRLTGLHFIDVKKYYSKMNNIINYYINNNSMLNMILLKYKRNEHFLYNIVMEGIGFDENLIKTNTEKYYRPHHGTHLGIIRDRGMNINTFNELESIPLYIHDEIIDKMLMINNIDEISLLKKYLKQHYDSI